MYLRINLNPYLTAVALITWVLVAPSTALAQPSADEIINKSLEVYGGDNSLSTLTFSFQESNEIERKLVYRMLWKDYKGKDGLSTKMIFFKEFPPDDKGIAYMSWIYRPDMNQDDDEWLYLPELRSVRKLSKKIDSHHEGRHQHDKDDEFAKSVLHRPHLVPRPVYLDRHQLLRTEDLDGKNFYVIERIPKKHTDDFPYSKTINWISADNYLLTKIDYYDTGGKVVIHQRINWQKIADAWVWDKVEATDVETGNNTTLTVSDVRVNIGIDDEAFTKRVMKLGIDSLRLGN